MRPLLAAAALSLCAPLLAQSPTASFAIFSPEQVASNTARGKKVFADVETLGKGLQEKINARIEELKKLDGQLKSPGLSEEGRAKIQRDLQDGEISLKRMQEDAQQEFNKTQQKAMKVFMEEIEPIVKEVQKEWKLQVVFAYQPGMLAAADDTWLLSFTNEVAKRYEAKGPAAAAPKAPAKPAAPKK
ncbi:MAG: OmpH family outer membrane protein [Acidobacteria bacterium]|nr:OmpH family outer membrane protein [Acidobacteriota bacterium]